MEPQEKWSQPWCNLDGSFSDVHDDLGITKLFRRTPCTFRKNGIEVEFYSLFFTFIGIYNLT